MKAAGNTKGIFRSFPDLAAFFGKGIFQREWAKRPAKKARGTMEAVLLTVKELAERINVPESWIYQRTRLGQKAIPHVRVGKYVRFDLNEVLEFLRKGALEEAP